MPVANPDSERERIRTAITALVAERGYQDTTLGLLLDRAGVDRAGFERHFPDLETCFTRVWVKGIAEAGERVLESYNNSSSWLEGMRAEAWTLCRFLQEDHDRARLIVVAAASAPEMVRAVRDQSYRLYASLIHLGTAERPEAADVPFAQAEAVAGAVWDRASKQVRAGAFDQIPRQVPDMMFMAVLPYLGLAAAQEELRRGQDDIVRYECGELQW